MATISTVWMKSLLLATLPSSRASRSFFAVGCSVFSDMSRPLAHEQARGLRYGLAHRPYVIERVVEKRRGVDRQHQHRERALDRHGEEEHLQLRREAAHEREAHL